MTDPGDARNTPTAGSRRTLGIVGGIAPGSTADYYSLTVERYRALRRDGSYPSILINRIGFNTSLRW